MAFAQLVLERETLRRRAVEVIVSQIRKYLISSVCSLQVCAGHEAGCELIIHAMHKIYEEESEVILLVDASNAFNSVNRKTFLHNIGITTFLPDFSSLVEGKFDLLKGKLKAIPLLRQFMQ